MTETNSKKKIFESKNNRLSVSSQRESFKEKSFHKNKENDESSSSLSSDFHPEFPVITLIIVFPLKKPFLTYSFRTNKINSN